jgi:hypothetical protein
VTEEVSTTFPASAKPRWFLIYAWNDARPMCIVPGERAARKAVRTLALAVFPEACFERLPELISSSRIISLNPWMPVSGVRNSWLTMDTKSLLTLVSRAS